MRYNQSAIMIAHSPKDKHFDYDKIPSIISIMFCEFDIYGLKESIYEIKRKVNDTDLTSNTGVQYIFTEGINLEHEAEDTSRAWYKN